MQVHSASTTAELGINQQMHMLKCALPGAEDIRYRDAKADKGFDTGINTAFWHRVELQPKPQHRACGWSHFATGAAIDLVTVHAICFSTALVQSVFGHILP